MVDFLFGCASESLRTFMKTENMYEELHYRAQAHKRRRCRGPQRRPRLPVAPVGPLPPKALPEDAAWGRI